MKRLLVIKSSLNAQHSASGALAEHAASIWGEQGADNTVVVRDLASEPVAHLSGQTVGAFYTPESARDEAQRQVLRVSDELIDELKQADALVLTAPMYNFSVPSQLKAWIDHVARVGVTFQYTENGPLGLLDDRPVIIVTSRGGVYSTEQDHQLPWLKQVLGFLGLTNIHVVSAQGLANETHKAQTLAESKQEIQQLVATALL